ncbi:MAG: DUF3631 domain-containing protein [Streptosporangiaceae bacterium]
MTGHTYTPGFDGFCEHCQEPEAYCDGARAALSTGGDISGQPQAPDGAALLDEVHDTLVRYVVFPSSEAADATTLYVVATHGQPAWEHATRFLAKSPEKRCGKSRLFEVARELVHRPRPAVSISAAALVRSIHPDDPPTLLVDEADRIYGSKLKSELNDDLTAILDVGFARDWPYTRYNAARNASEDHPTFAMAMLAAKGVDLPDTIEDRAVIVTMRRRAPGETVAQFRRRDIPPLREIRDRLHEWIRGSLSVLDDVEPDMPVEDRAADCWESLTAVADLAGGDWPERARHACEVLVGAAADDTSSVRVRLLADLRDVWPTSAGTPGTSGTYLARYVPDVPPVPEPWHVAATDGLLDRLHAIEEAPWADWYGHPLNARELAKMLKGFGVHSTKVRIGDRSVRGYRREDLHDAWLRYLPQKRNIRNKRNAAGRDVADVALVADPPGSRPSPPLDTHPGRKDGLGVSVCASCHEPMTVIEVGQTTHPGCGNAWPADSIGAEENEEDQ